MDGTDFSFAWNERGPLDVGGRTRAIMIDPNDPSGQTIWAGSVAGGLWKSSGIDALIAVGATELSAQTSNLTIFPNPIINAGTNIQFSIAAPATVQVLIRDYSGKMVAQLFDNPLLQPGNYHLKWQPAPQLSNGIYYACFISNAKLAVEKVVLMR